MRKSLRNCGNGFTKKETGMHAPPRIPETIKNRWLALVVSTEQV
jgi:hypothetical protein